VRSGFLAVGRLQVVDAFGQTLQLSDPNSPAGFQPIVARGLQPAGPERGLPAGAVQLPPRVVQATRLNMRFPDAGTSAPVAGWLLPNHIDRAISVYDAAGIALGEVRTADPPDSWRPRPGPDGGSPAPRTPAEIADPALRAAVVSMTSQPRTVIDDLLTTIDETLWLVDPLGGRKDQFLSVLIGRPLAVVQATLQLSLFGDPAFSQLWDHTAEPNDSPPPAYTRRRDTGGIGDIAFPVRLGELDLPGDGLLGYWLPDGGYSRFYASHVAPGAVAAGDAYIRPILSRGRDEVLRYQGDIALHCDGDAVRVTMLVDPRGAVHAYTGILPVTSAALPAHVVEDFMKRLAVTFDAGPVVANPTALRLPLPARRQAAWQWVEAVPGGWTEETVLDADNIARLSGARNELREGWLRFSGGEET
jgi:hypothetical protein